MSNVEIADSGWALSIRQGGSSRGASFKIRLSPEYETQAQEPQEGHDKGAYDSLPEGAPDVVVPVPQVPDEEVVFKVLLFVHLVDAEFGVDGLFYDLLEFFEFFL